MLCFTFNSKEDMQEKIINGHIQEETYNYLNELVQSKELLDHENVLEYFEASFSDFYITYEELINNSKQEIVILRKVIIAVYERLENERINATQ